MRSESFALSIAASESADLLESASTTARAEGPTLHEKAFFGQIAYRCMLLKASNSGAGPELTSSEMSAPFPRNRKLEALDLDPPHEVT